MWVLAPHPHVILAELEAAECRSIHQNALLYHENIIQFPNSISVQ